MTNTPDNDVEVSAERLEELMVEVEQERGQAFHGDDHEGMRFWGPLYCALRELQRRREKEAAGVQGADGSAPADIPGDLDDIARELRDAMAHYGMDAAAVALRRHFSHGQLDELVAALRVRAGDGSAPADVAEVVRDLRKVREAAWACRWRDECVAIDRAITALQSGQQKDARIAQLTRDLQEAREAFESIRVYGSDTLSGPAQKVDDIAAWYRDGVMEMRNRALAALAKGEKGSV